jgi:hypothetical protein
VVLRPVLVDKLDVADLDLIRQILVPVVPDLVPTPGADT